MKNKMSFFSILGVLLITLSFASSASAIQVDVGGDPPKNKCVQIGKCKTD